MGTGTTTGRSPRRSSRRRLPNLRALDWLARISYPLYLVHGLNGYLLLFVLGRLTGSYLLALPVVVGLVYLLAATLNRSVEEPLQRLARSLSRRLGLDRRPAPSPAPETSAAAPAPLIPRYGAGSGGNQRWRLVFGTTKLTPAG